MKWRKAKRDLHMTDIPTLASTNQRNGLSCDRLRRRPIQESIRRVRGGSRAGRGWHAHRTKEGSLLYNRRKREGKRKKGFAKRRVGSENSREESWPIEWCYDTTTFLLRTPTERAGRSTNGAAGRLWLEKWPCCRRTHWTLRANITIQTRHFITTALRRIISIQLFFSVLCSLPLSVR